MKKKLATIYPYSKNDVQFFRYASFLKEIQPVYAVSPPGWGLSGNDVTEIDGGKCIGIKIIEDLIYALKNSELLILTSFERFYGQKGGLIETIKIAIQCKKPFMLFSSVKTTEEKEVLEKAESLGLVYHIPVNKFDFIKESTTINCCENLKVPVTFIVAQGPGAGKFETQLGLYKELLQSGYKVSLIGTRPYCELFGFHSFPSFMFSKELDETEKVIAFNRFAKQMEKEEEPDLIIVGIPGGTMPIAEKVHNNYGILHVELASALEPDNVIYNLYSNSYNFVFFEDSIDFIYHRFNHAETCCFVITNTWLDYGGIKERDILKATTFRKMYDEIKERPKDIPVISILEPNAFAKVKDASLIVLEEYGVVNYY
jgi:peptide maturation system protein (TIGR04066 family)